MGKITIKRRKRYAVPLILLTAVLPLIGACTHASTSTTTSTLSILTSSNIASSTTSISSTPMIGEIEATEFQGVKLTPINKHL